MANSVFLNLYALIFLVFRKADRHSEEERSEVT